MHARSLIVTDSISRDGPDIVYNVSQQDRAYGIREGQRVKRSCLSALTIDYDQVVPVV